MNSDMGDTADGGDTGDIGGFAAPPFDPQAALLLLQRALRDLKLAERGGGFDLRGRRVVELKVGPTQLDVRLARRLAMTLEWDLRPVKSTVEQRKVIDEIRQRLSRWERED